ncbi:MAG TPA: hypothetical protein VN962_14960 [Polyangia bacterium]|nr:hypothetical protein [Polyangia bacterium]
MSPTEVATSWSVRTPFPELSIIADDATRPGDPATEYSMVIDVRAPIDLRGLAAKLGPYRTVAESKTSTVIFVGVDATGSISAELLSSKVLADAPVIRIVARAPTRSR